MKKVILISFSFYILESNLRVNKITVFLYGIFSLNIIKVE